MLTVRAAELGDARRLSEIYEPYVLHTTVSYEYDPVSPEEFASRMKGIMEKYPYLVAEDEGKVVGFAYASPYHSRRAYDWSCELSVYVEEGCLGGGIGTLLYEKLLAVLREMNFCVAYSVIDIPNDASMALHRKFGFQKVGVFPDIAFKQGRWLTIAVLEKRLRNLPEVPLPVRRDWRNFVR